MSAGGPSWVLLLERKESARLSADLIPPPVRPHYALATLAHLVRPWSEDLFAVQVKTLYCVDRAATWHTHTLAH